MNRTVYVVFKHSRFNWKKPMTLFNWITQKVIGHWDHVEFMVFNGDVFSTYFIGADGGKKYKKVRKIPSNIFFKENTKCELRLYPVHEGEFDIDELIVKINDFVDVEYDYENTLIAQPIDKLTGRWLSNDDPLSKLACGEYCAMILEKENWQEMEPTELHKEFEGLDYRTINN